MENKHQTLTRWCYQTCPLNRIYHTGWAQNNVHAFHFIKGSSTINKWNGRNNSSKSSLDWAFEILNENLENHSNNQHIYYIIKNREIVKSTRLSFIKI